MPQKVKKSVLSGSTPEGWVSFRIFEMRGILIFPTFVFSKCRVGFTFHAESSRLKVPLESSPRDPPFGVQAVFLTRFDFSTSSRSGK